MNVFDRRAERAETVVNVRDRRAKRAETVVDVWGRRAKRAETVVNVRGRRAKQAEAVVNIRVVGGNFRGYVSISMFFLNGFMIFDNCISLPFAWEPVRRQCDLYNVGWSKLTNQHLLY